MAAEAASNAGKHGSYGYATTSACGCEPCHAAVRDYHRRRRRMISEGTWPWREWAEPVKRHIQELRESGISWASIQGLSGVPQSTIKSIIYGDNGVPRKQIRADVARRLLAVRLEDVRLKDLSPKSLVLAEPYQEMIREMARAGISRRRVAIAAGHTFGRASGPGPTYYQRFESMTVETALKIQRLHWAAWLRMPEMREICRCEVPPEVLRMWRREDD